MTLHTGKKWIEERRGRSKDVGYRHRQGTDIIFLKKYQSRWLYTFGWKCLKTFQIVKCLKYSISNIYFISHHVVPTSSISAPKPTGFEMASEISLAISCCSWISSIISCTWSISLNGKKEGNVILRWWKNQFHSSKVYSVKNECGREAFYSFFHFASMNKDFVF